MTEAVDTESLEATLAAAVAEVSAQPEPHHHHVNADGEPVAPGRRIEPGQVWLNTPETPERSLWIDASEGVAGDMLLAALIDAGADAGSIATVLDRVAPGKLHLQTRAVKRGGMAALKVDVIADEPEPPVRHLAEIEEMLDHSGVPEKTRDWARAAFRRLAKAEARAHGDTVDSVHFHEVGALDSIGDIVGVCEALRTLNITSATSSVVAVGAGQIQTSHGTLAVPPPAVAELARGWQIEAGGGPEVGELCTPTGMTLIRTVCQAVEPLPSLLVESVGRGAGTRIRADRPGLVRVLIGTKGTASVVEAPVTDPAVQAVHLIEANVDDLDPRLWPAVYDRVLDAGAIDVWLTPIVMKKGRPGHTLSALSYQQHLDAVTDAFVTHTSTIGIRISAPGYRRVLQRIWRTIDLEGQPVRIKISGDGPGATIQQATAEFVDVERVARVLDQPQRIVLARAGVEAWSEGLYPGAPWPAPDLSEDAEGDASQGGEINE
ncbi:nickel pincer cofactor biosynthesis protein LarC [Scrofimicrobium sp. R131]|uniref:Pyridinium-3,5-bisthiocarboxylic acid mononucleotide nickel insertion protein n=1 Tax=Scrofimicrobium appendicitidis TaxID=3079930 RepID=A0AAU7V5F6_9ACTO